MEVCGKRAGLSEARESVEVSESFITGSHEVILMLFVYPKNVQDDLTHEQLRVLRKVIDEEYP